jgi:hypothetical protein
MVRMSRTRGILWSVTVLGVSRQAAKAGRAEFFAPPIFTSPSSGRRLQLEAYPFWVCVSSAAERLPSARSIFVPLLAGESQSCHHDGDFWEAAAGFQQLSGAVVADVGGLGDDAPGTILQLRVYRTHVHHEVAIDVAEADHDGGADHVEDEFCGRSGFQAGRTGQDLGAG